MKKIEIFERIEQKYLLNQEQYEMLFSMIKDHLEKDEYFKSTICNIYFDTDNYDLIINSLEKKEYKEKVRLRSYNIPSLNDTVFLEIKSKYNGVVYKRRITLKLSDFYSYLDNKNIESSNPQIMNELDYVIKRYKLIPKCFLAYDRLSYYDKDNPCFRITIDSNIRSRNDNLYLESGDSGNLLFKEPHYIMELKNLGSLPLWLVNILSKLKIYPTSFSKYGNIYSKGIKEEIYV